MAGAEALFPVTDHENLFKLARENNIPYTIHAGEAAGPESIWNAIKLGATRIGHGTTSINDEKLIECLVKYQIPLEMCPTSNYNTKVIESISEHPIKELLAKKIIKRLS